MPLFRYWNGAIGDHFYTTNWGELGRGRSGWRYEGIQCWVLRRRVAGTVTVEDVAVETVAVGTVAAEDVAVEAVAVGTVAAEDVAVEAVAAVTGRGQTGGGQIPSASRTR